MNRQQRRAQRTNHPAVPGTWAETLARCPFRSFIGGKPDVAGMARDIGATIAAIGGEPCPTEPSRLADMVAALHAGKSVLVLADRADLRDYHKREILMAAYGAAGSA